MMPELDGFTFLKEKRREIDIPVLFLTAKNFEQDLVEGFSVGADDYMIKPFSIKELRYRIMAHLRRENRTKSNLIHIGNIFCDFTARKIYVNEAEINLTSTEYEICSLLMRNPDKMKKAGFTTTKGEFVNAPIINELPLTLECELVKVIDGSKYLAEIKNVSADDKYLGDDGEIDLSKFTPITYDPVHHGYYRLGERVGNAFKDGAKLK